MSEMPAPEEEIKVPLGSKILVPFALSIIGLPRKNISEPTSDVGSLIQKVGDIIENRIKTDVILAPSNYKKSIIPNYFDKKELTDSSDYSTVIKQTLYEKYLKQIAKEMSASIQHRKLQILKIQSSIKKI